MIHMLDKGGSQLCLKLDMMKAFDRVSWEYLELLLRRFGFSDFFIRLVINHLSATRVSVLINGQPSPAFRPFIGVKQGDPLSPLLFILSSEGFSRGIKSLSAAGQLQSFRLGRIPLTITHLAYADDLLVFLKGTRRNLIHFRTFLTQYERASGQKVNYHKSNFIPSASVTVSQQRSFKAILDMRLSSLPFRYLGSYLHKGINRALYCTSLLQHIDGRLQGWHTRLLSYSGRLVLLKSVIAALPLHVLAAGGLPKSVIHIINRKMASFFWGDRRHWVSWSRITQPYDEGGLGLREITQLQRAYHCRIWWAYHKKDTLWSTYMHLKYGRRSDFRPRLVDSATWKLICRIHPFCISHTTGADATLSWTPSSTGEFSLKSAYETCRTSISMQLSSKFIWFKHHSPYTRLLLWRIFHSALPFEDCIGRYSVVRPTRCPFCKQESATLVHVFLRCNCILPIWMFVATELHGLLPARTSLRPYLLSWWFRANTSTLSGVLKVVIPAIIVNNIWKQYAQLIYGDSSSFSPSRMRNAIHFDINLWVQSIQGSKLVNGPPLSLSWIPRLRPPRIRLVKWQCPPSGRYKLNVDGAVGARYAAGGAILRTSTGACVGVVSFRLPQSSPLMAEIQATLFGLLYFLRS